MIRMFFMQRIGKTGGLGFHSGRQWVLDSGRQRERRYVMIHLTLPQIGITKVDAFWIWPNILEMKALIGGRRYSRG